MTIINLTNKDMTIYNDQHEKTVFPSEGYLILRMIPGNTLSVNGIKIHELIPSYTFKFDNEDTVYIGLPEEQEGVLYIVQRNVLKNARRRDFISHGTPLANENGFIGYSGYICLR